MKTSALMWQMNRQTVTICGSINPFRKKTAHWWWEWRWEESGGRRQYLWRINLCLCSPSARKNINLHYIITITIKHHHHTNTVKARLIHRGQGAVEPSGASAASTGPRWGRRRHTEPRSADGPQGTKQTWMLSTGACRCSGCLQSEQYRLQKHRQRLEAVQLVTHSRSLVLGGTKLTFECAGETPAASEHRWSRISEDLLLLHSWTGSKQLLRNQSALMWILKDWTKADTHSGREETTVHSSHDSYY